jgi:hypothetical protein
MDGAAEGALATWCVGTVAGRVEHSDPNRAIGRRVPVSLGAASGGRHVGLRRVNSARL